MLRFEAVDGSSALKVTIPTADIDLLITDVGLPGGMNRRQIADAARSHRPDLKVLFITGYAETAVVRNGYLEPGTGNPDKAVYNGSAGHEDAMITDGRDKPTTEVRGRLVGRRVKHQSSNERSWPPGPFRASGNWPLTNLVTIASLKLPNSRGNTIMDPASDVHENAPVTVTEQVCGQKAAEASEVEETAKTLVRFVIPAGPRMAMMFMDAKNPIIHNLCQ